MMLTKIILDELKSIHQLLDTTLHKMDDLLSPKTANFMWRLFFPAGQFIQQKSAAREASILLLRVDKQFREMEEVLDERQHPLKPQISELLNIDLIKMSEMLVELPERAQYMITQVTKIKEIVETNIQELSS
ncbi:MAG: hypothetical protein ACTSQH_09595 [Candidatus Hodarchaeales archaeon]